MTSGTTHVGKTERQNLIAPRTQAYFVAVRAGNRRVRPGQRVARLAVHCKGESRLMEILDGVATFTSVLIRSGGKLAVMGVLVAVRAGREFYLVDRIFPCWQVALVTFHLDVFASQRIA